MKHRKGSRGNLLAMTLLILGIAVLMTATLIRTNAHTLIFTSTTNHRHAAITQAQAGLNQALHRMTYDSGFTESLSHRDGQEGWSLEFGRGQSINNLNSSFPTLNGVPANGARIVVRGYSGPIEREVIATVRRGVLASMPGPNGAQKNVVIEGDLTLGGVKDLDQLLPTANRFHSNHRAERRLPAMAWSPMGGQITLNGSSELSTVQPEPGALAFTSNLEASVGSSLDDSTYKHRIPSLDISKVVSAKRTLPQPVRDSEGVIFLEEDAYHSGDMFIGEGEELLLGEADLYIDGDLTVRGSLLGRGGIVATGDVLVEGGNGTVQGGSSGTKLLSGGETRLLGIGTSGLAPDVGRSPEFATFRNALEEVSRDPGSAAKRATAITLADSFHNSLDSAAPSPENDQNLRQTQELRTRLQAFNNYLNGTADPRDLARIGLAPSKTSLEPTGTGDEPLSSPDPERLRSFLELNQDSLGTGHFQGIVYSVGDLTIGDGFRVVGSVITQGRAELKGGVSLLFNEAYVKKEPGRFGNFAVVSYEER